MYILANVHSPLSILGHTDVYTTIQARPTRFLTQKTSVNWKKGGHKKAFLEAASLYKNHYKKCIQACRLPRQQEKLFIFLWPAFVARILTPWSRKSGYGLVDQDSIAGAKNNLFFWRCWNKKNRKIIIWRPRPLSQTRNRSGVVELVGREPLRFARVENGVTKFWPKSRKGQNFGSETAVFNGELSFFLPRKTPTFFLGGGVSEIMVSR